MTSKITKRRTSVFRELGLDTNEPTSPYSAGHEFAQLTGLTPATSSHAPEPANYNASEDNGDNGGEIEGERRAQQRRDHRDGNQSEPTSPSACQRPWYSRLTSARRPRIKTVSSAPPPSMSAITRISSIALLIAVLLPGLSHFRGHDEVAPVVADAGVIHTKAAEAGPVLEPRADSPTKVCKRWAHQSELRSI